MSSVSCRSMDDVVNFAISREENAIDFYRQCASRARNPGIREFFHEMAREEERHRTLLADLNPSSLGDLKLEKVEDLRISDYLLDITFTEKITYQEALTLAMKKEEKAHAFYEAWKNKCIHEDTGKLFALLANEELKHKRKIETLYDEHILTWD